MVGLMVGLMDHIWIPDKNQKDLKVSGQFSDWSGNSEPRNDRRRMEKRMGYLLWHKEKVRPYLEGNNRIDRN